MEILVDYNNVREVDRRKGPVFVIEKLIYALGPDHVAPNQRILVRLYDGWYERQAPTRSAQDIASELQTQMPTVIAVGTGARQVKVRVNAELAYSLKSAPTQHMWHTYRPRVRVDNIRCYDLRTIGCNDPQCPLKVVPVFFQGGRCPKPGCAVTPSTLLYRNQQKLVDTMIAADLFALHLQSSRKLGIVTSDDDLWPAIKLLLQLGIQVIHIHTIPGKTTPAMYSKNAGSGYVQLQL